MKKEQITFIITLILSVFICKSSFADSVLGSGTCGENATRTLDNRGNLTISGNGNMYKWNNSTHIPWENYKDDIKAVYFEGKVTSIAAYAFHDYTSLSSVLIPNTVTEIGEYAFDGCVNLKSISIPKSVTSIDTSAFCNLGITSLTIPHGNIKYGGSVFAFNKNLKSVSLPEGMEYITYNMFGYCNNLTGVILPSTLKVIEMNGFRECVSLKSIIIPEGVTTIGMVAFWGCSGLTDVTIPESVTKIDEWAFKKCKDLKNVTINPDTLSNLDPNVFEECPNAVFHEAKAAGDLVYIITNAATNGSGAVTLIGVKNKKATVVVPATTVIDSVTYKVNRIATTAFFNDKTVKTVTIGANVEIIDANAFYGGSNLVKVYGGARLKTIGNNAFARCTKLSSFTITSKVLSKIGVTAFYKDSKLKTLKLKNTTKLTKKGVKKSLKGSSVKTVKVKKSKIRKYKKIFKKSNSGRKVKVKK